MEGIKNRFSVYKWLMEMNGILENDSNDKIYQKKFVKALQKATSLSWNMKYSTYNFKLDDHFKYLEARQKIKVIYLKILN